MMEWLTPSQLNPFTPVEITCTLCRASLSLEQWPRHLLTAVHQNQAYAKCGLWDYLERSNVFVIYCNIPVEPISFIDYLRNACRVEVKDFILVPGKPSIAILQFHSSKEYTTFLNHSKQIKIRCGDLIVTHATPSTGISVSGWMSLVNYDGPKLTLNYNETSHARISPNVSTPITPAEINSPVPGPSSSRSCQRLSGCSQVPERSLEQLAIDSGWPPPKFELERNNLLAGKYTAKVTLNGRIFCSNNVIAGDSTTACKIFADHCLKTLEEEKRDSAGLKGYDGNAHEDLCRLLENRKWSMSETSQYIREQTPGRRQVFFYSSFINGEQYFSPMGGTTRDEGIAQLSAYCLKKTFNITRHSQTNPPPPKITPLQKPAENQNSSSTPSSSSLTSSIYPPPKHSDTIPTSNVNLNQSQRSSSLSTPTIAARIPQPAKRKITEDPATTSSSTNQLPTKRQASLNDKNKISTEYELTLEELERSISLTPPSIRFQLRANNNAPSTSTSQNTPTNHILNPEIEVLYDESTHEETEIAHPQPIKICDHQGEIEIVNEVWRKPEEEMHNTNVKVKTEKYASPWPQYFLPKEYIKTLKHSVATLEKICLVCNWEKPSYDLMVSQSSIEDGSERFSYKMTLNEIEYKNERVEITKKESQDKVAQICLTALAHNGEIPHPSIFMKVSLNPVRRLENLIISRRLPKGSQNEPKYTLIENLEEKGYCCEVNLNGESYATSTSEKTEKEAKKKAAKFCLQKLSSSMPLFADGSLTEKAKTALITMSTEIPTITETDKEIHAKYESFKNQCEKIFTKMKIEEEKWKIAEAIPKKLRNLVPGLKGTMYKNWYMKLKSYTDNDYLFIFVFKTDDKKTSIKHADPEEVEKHILGSSEKFPGLTVTKFANSNSARHFKQSVHNFESQPSFVLKTDPNTLIEVRLCRLIHYISKFDSRFLPVLSLLRYWARINRVRFHPSGNSKIRNILGDPFFLDLLLVSFLGGAGVIPTARELLERKSRFSKQNEKQIFLQPDADYVKQWRSNGRPFKSNSVEFWLSVLVLTRNFFLYYADRFKEGGWVLNICDSEMIFCQDLYSMDRFTQNFLQKIWRGWRMKY